MNSSIKTSLTGFLLIVVPIAIVALLSILVVNVVDVGSNKAEAATEPQELTVGNSTFIPLPVDYAGNFAQKKLAMEAVQKFEKAHPELVVLCWNSSYIVGSMNVAIDGVNIYHRAK